MTATGITLTPYLSFNGDAAEAMRYYQSILGGELKMQTFGEAKMAETPQEKDLIVHAILQTDSLTFMASDTHPSRQAIFGDSVQMSVTGQERRRLTEVFNKLAQGGRVDMPLAKQFWGDTFGMLTDRFGIHWMINIPSQAQE